MAITLIRQLPSLADLGLTAGDIIATNHYFAIDNVNPGSGTRSIKVNPQELVSILSENGGKFLPSGIQGDVLYHNGTDWVTLAPGTSGQFLQTQGAGANPMWQGVVAAAVGANTVISNPTAASSPPTDFSINTDSVLGRFSGNLVNVAVLDEDDLVSDSATALATQQSIKAYVDSNSGTPAGSDTQVQFNDSGSFGANAGFMYDVPNKNFFVTNVNQSSHTGTEATLIGLQNSTFNSSTDSFCTSVGARNVVGDEAYAFGFGVIAGDNSIGIGKGVVTSSNELQFGSHSLNITDVYLGGSGKNKSQGTATPAVGAGVDYTIHGSGANDPGVGNLDGGDINLRGGKRVNSGLDGSVNFLAGTAGTTIMQVDNENHKVVVTGDSSFTGNMLELYNSTGMNGWNFQNHGKAQIRQIGAAGFGSMIISNTDFESLSATNCLVYGRNLTTSGLGNFSTYIGNNITTPNTSGVNMTVIGHGHIFDSSTLKAVTVGYSNNFNNADNSTSIGNDNIVTTNSIVVGHNNDLTGHTAVIAIGNGITSSSNNEAIIGGTGNDWIQTLWLGEGAGTTANDSPDVTIRVTDSSTQAGDLILRASSGVTTEGHIKFNDDSNTTWAEVENTNKKFIWHHKGTSQSTSGSVTIDLATLDLHELTLTGDITDLTFTNGVKGEKYDIFFIQDGTGARTLTIAPDWVTATSYSIGDIIKEGGKYYKANTAHTASALFITDIANWDLYLTTPQAVDITLSTAANQEDWIQVFVRDTDRYILTPKYEVA